MKNLLTKDRQTEKRWETWEMHIQNHKHTLTISGSYRGRNYINPAPKWTHYSTVSQWNLVNLAHVGVYQPFQVTPGPLPLCVAPGVEDSHQILGAVWRLHLAEEEKSERKGKKCWGICSLGRKSSPAFAHVHLLLQLCIYVQKSECCDQTYPVLG